MAPVRKHRTIANRRLPKRLRQKSGQYINFFSPNKKPDEDKSVKGEKEPQGSLHEMIWSAIDRFDFSEETDRQDVLRNIVINALQCLPADASWQEIRQTVYYSVVRTLPVDVINRAVEVFHSEANALEWLVTDNLALGGLAPIDVLEKDSGKEEVFDVLGRIEHGIIS